MSDYARPMPALGFDPAPGDVGLTRSLAKQYGSVITELESTLSVVRGVSTGAWEGDAAGAFRVLLGTIPPAIQSTITTAQALRSAASSWAGQLAGFQSEADALEKQAATAQANPPKPPPAPAAGHPGPAAGPGADPSPPDGIRAKAHELNGRYLAAAAKTAASVPEDPGLWEKTEPIRKVLEFVLAPLDIADADHWIDWLEKAAGVPASWLKGIDKQIDVIESLQKEGTSASDALTEAANLIDRAGSNWNAWDAFAPGWLKVAANNLGEIRGAGTTLSVLGLVADAGTIISPQDSGAMGWADRGVATINGGLIVANMATDEIPVVGEVTMAATGLYLAGDFLYHHWTPFHDAANAVGHATVKAADWAGHEASSAWHTVTGWL